MIPHPPSLLPNKLHTDPSLRTEDSLSSRVRTAFVCACIQPCVRVSNRVGADDGARCFQLPPTLDQRWQQSQFSSLGSCTRQSRQELFLHRDGGGGGGAVCARLNIRNGVELCVRALNMHDGVAVCAIGLCGTWRVAAACACPECECCFCISGSQETTAPGLQAIPQRKLRTYPLQL